jgi:catechol 2,3-dioxygenase-like lactoylglutathione lyase family enzyme
MSVISAIRLDHLVIAVRDLETAVSDYTRLGFNVTPGGRHTHAPTRNALIYFDDGAYLELIEWLEPANGQRWYEHLSSAGEGIVDFALCPEDIACVIGRTGGKGVDYQAPVPGSRVQASGEEIRWQLGWPVHAALPFLCADITPRHLRVPEGACRQHPNGVKGIREIAVGVADLDVAVRAYERLLQVKASHPRDMGAASERLGFRVASFRIGEVGLLLIEPGQVETPVADTLREQLTRRGPGPYRFTLKAAGDGSMALNRALTHGASISIDAS